MRVSVLPERPRRGSMRLRRVTWTISILGVLLAILAVVTWRVRKENQPDEYVPGEASKDVTNVEMDRGAKTPVAQAAPHKLTRGQLKPKL